MNKVIIFLFLIFPLYTFGQEVSKKKSHLSLEAKGLILFPKYDSAHNRGKNIQQQMSNNYILGLNAELNYYFWDDFLGLGVGVGHERVSKPDFSYLPIYLNGILNLSEEFYLNIGYGIHKGQVDHSGALHRAGLGYRLKINNMMQVNFTLLYSFQNVYKSFPEAEEWENYYNFESVGLAISLKIN